MPGDRPSARLTRAIAHMRAGGELRVHLQADGLRCTDPPMSGTGVIVGPLGRITVSHRTVRALRGIGTRVHLFNHFTGRAERGDTYEKWETWEPSGG